MSPEACQNVEPNVQVANSWFLALKSVFLCIALNTVKKYQTRILHRTYININKWNLDFIIFLTSVALMSSSDKSFQWHYLTEGKVNKKTDVIIWFLLVLLDLNE